METRLASVHDAPSLSRLHSECFTEGRWSDSQLAETLALPTTQTWIALEGHLPRGFLMAQIVEDEAEILTFCVAPAQRCTGVGTLLFDTMVTQLRNRQVAKVFLEVASTNAAARAFYEKNGFLLSGKRLAYYKKGDETIDALILDADL